MYKQSTKLEEQRKIALDEHLNFIVDQTEKMSTLVAESLMKSVNNSSVAALQNSSLVNSEGMLLLKWSQLVCIYLNLILIFLIGKTAIYHSSPNINTLEGNVKYNDKIIDHKNEIDMLKKESKLSLDDVLEQLPKGYLESRSYEINDEVQYYEIL